MHATQPIASLRFFQVGSGETIAVTHVLVQESDTVARFCGLVVDMLPGVLAYEVTLQMPPRQDDSSEVERLRAALVEATARAIYGDRVSDDDDYATAREELRAEGLLPPD